MTEGFSNDNGAPEIRPRVPEPDAYVQAALLLVESVLHGLIEKSVFSVAKAVELVDIAAEVKQDIGADLGDSAPTLQRSLGLLAAISNSLQSDGGIQVATD